MPGFEPDQFWPNPPPLASGVSVGVGRTLDVEIPIGSHGLSVSGRDPRGGVSTATVTVRVQDSTPPGVSLTVLSNRLVAEASDTVGISRVSFELDGQPFGPLLSAAPFEIPWSRGSLSDGTHSFSAVATDTSGNRTVSEPRTVVVDNTPPVVSLAVLSNRLVAQATDASGLASVSFELDGQPFGTVMFEPPFEIPWSRSSLSDGPHSFRAVATDAVGNRVVSVPVTVVADNTPPALVVEASPAFIWPPNNKLVPVQIAISLTDAIDIAPTVVLEAVACNDGCSPGTDIVGAAIGSDDRSVFVRAKRTGAGSGRTYSLTYKAMDSAGNGVRETVQIVVPHDQH